MIKLQKITLLSDAYSILVYTNGHFDLNTGHKKRHAFLHSVFMEYL